MENPRAQTYQEEIKAVTTLRSGKIIDNKVGLDNNKANEEKEKEKECLREESQTDKVFLNEQVSSVLQYNTPPKLKDPGVPTITCFIGDKRIDRALLDFGSSVNLIPYSVYEELGLGELQPTNMTLQLADRSIKVPRHGFY
ncbi:uncharacterized protein G2W53_037359 [Senna tora]|uniref:Uncharacterized protein n=1 Tax=Senna tora TaxID=362788 RepID=A0A834SX67_9FABA|nr:uncharacterized protein G2W53_037359 [Senna tora]